MNITILTLFPEIFYDVFNSSIIDRARRKNLLKINLVNIRDFATDKHKSVDDKPYGGGVGMIMRVDVIDRAISSAKCKPACADRVQSAKFKERIILMDPKGTQFNQSKARELAKLEHLILVCGHYEGVDDRINQFIDERLSIGNFVLTGGEIPAMAVTDSVCRLYPGVLKDEATENESFSSLFKLEYPQYTRPEIYKGQKVPQVLLSGNHREIIKWKNDNKKDV